MARGAAGGDPPLGAGLRLRGTHPYPLPRAERTPRARVRCWSGSPAPRIPRTPWIHGAAQTFLPPSPPAGSGSGPRLEAADLERTAVGWGLGAYRFDRYRGKEQERERAVLCTDPGTALRAGRQIEAIALVRDLINTPAGDLLPGDLFEAARSLAGRFGAECSSITGDELVANGYPAIHAVGRASADPPRLIDSPLGGPLRPAGDPGRQGGVLRHRRPRSEARERHAPE